MENVDEKKSILYIRNVSEELKTNIEDLMLRRNYKTRNAAVRSMIEDYPKALQKIQELKTKNEALQSEIENYKSKIEVFKRFKKILDSL